MTMWPWNTSPSLNSEILFQENTLDEHLLICTFLDIIITHTERNVELYSHII